ncbi:hypothetical protein TREMEDRAFT_73837 [Tremella mesenterica DSM 1558]|uniref:uncharacterized protein n=1 Tax=Tremella mesenterica (strain ATCC 24925 / CBS 8224 / DSM 1558 / NBRC 9311 / NRRL Y-6157 / RJB 2259-6 / UBC 559-6) TaxID=578456 RepID=UPI0003F4A07F|nr:uncharacterized protein TREMEDRAFT_73837 [Tremella mesenterica DSM 1558]EIW69398.1 hypothetical protein TREMEDRAFT_73837 [Tremella mesenterica DSM 1558]
MIRLKEDSIASTLTRPLVILSKELGLDVAAGTSLFKSNHVLGMLLGGTLWAAFIALFRKLAGDIGQSISHFFFPSAYITSEDPARQWVEAWIASDPIAQARIGDFIVQTTYLHNMRSSTRNIIITSHGSKIREYEHDRRKANTRGEEVIAQALPLSKHTLRLSFNGQWVWVTLSDTSWSQAKDSRIRLTTTCFQRQAVREFLAEAHSRYFKKESQEIFIFHSCDERYSHPWGTPMARPVRPWSSVILPGTMKEDLLRDIESFLSPEEVEWYAKTGIPHRRGYLFYGEPGGGKSTLVAALASKLRLDIYTLSLSGQMDDARLNRLLRECRPRSIILIEDIDRAFAPPKGHELLLLEEEIEIEHHKRKSSSSRSTVPEKPPQVTMSGLLNAIDGVSSQEGCILIASTNHPDQLDQALSRAGRFDVRVPFYPAQPDQARRLFLHFYSTYPSTSLRTSRIDLSSLSPESVKEKDISHPDHSNDMGVENNKHQCDERSTTKSEILEELAIKFADALFPSFTTEEEQDQQIETQGPKLSMASIQGYLLRCKKDPWAAVEYAAKWKEVELAAMSFKRPKSIKIKSKKTVKGVKSVTGRKEEIGTTGEDESGNEVGEVQVDDTAMVTSVVESDN